MAVPPKDTLLHQIRQLAGEAETQRLTDRQLLLRFTDAQDQDAFQMLVHRHGPLVLGLCRRLLGNGHDADDAFQATFIILVRRAGTLAWQDSVGPWLYQVAHRVVRKVQTAAARRRTLEREAADLARTPSASAPTDADLHQRLHEELDRLPAKYRDPLVLCYLQGKTHEEAAQELGWPRGSMARRLGRGQDLLKDRLVARGAALTIGLTALLATEQAALPAVPASLLDATVILVDSSAQATLPGAVAALVEGVMHAMFLHKLRMIAIGILVVGVLAGGLGLLWSATQAAPPPEAVPKEAPARAASPTEITIRPWVVWSGAHSQAADAGYRRITSSAEWENLWLTHTGKALREAADAIPQIDFQQGMVVAVFQGAQFNCRGVQPVSITETTDAITVRFAGNYYQTDGKADGVKPFGFFLLPRSSKSLVLEENVQNLLGQPPVWKLRVQFDAVGLAPGKAAAPAVRPADPNIPVSFDRDIQPILLAKCGVCHAVNKPKGRFDCRTYAGFLQGGASGSPGIVPGDPDKSEVWNEIGPDEMPPKGFPKLTAAEKTTILQWIKAGARPKAIATDAESIRERLKRIAGTKRDQESPVSEAIRQACNTLLAKDLDLTRQFIRPPLERQENNFRNGLAQTQMQVGLAMFKLDTVLEELLGLKEQVAQEPKEWQAVYAYVVARLQAQEALMYEYNAQLGQLRKEFPELDLQLHKGWQLIDGPNFTDRDAKAFADRAMRTFDKLAKDQPTSEWAEFGKEESTAQGGLLWKPWPRAEK